MRKIQFLAIAVVMVAFGFTNCTKQDQKAAATKQQSTWNTSAMQRAVYTGFPEDFESGSKAAYAVGNVTLATGSWTLDDALIGSTTSDRKNGTKSVRMQNTGTITMNFDVTNGAYLVTIAHGTYGTDASSTWQLWYSTNGGSTYTQTGSTVTTSSTTLSTASFSPNLTGNVRFQLRKLGGGRLNIDDISITDNAGTGGGGSAPTDNDNMAMGNPSGATAVATNTNNYLMVKTQYDLSYNNSKGMSNWVSWHLQASDVGTVTRCDCFTADASLPSGFYRATTSNYTNTGFDRGHMCPSDDRTSTSTDNAATFLMTNITPQAPILNQQTWESLEAYSRTLANAGNELFIIAGSYGTGGTGSNGGTTSTIASGNINVPAHFYKIIVVLPTGNNDVSRVTSSTRVIAIDMPNNQGINAHPWGYYRTSINSIQTATGYNFLGNLSSSLQTTLKAVVDNGPTS